MLPTYDFYKNVYHYECMLPDSTIGHLLVTDFENQCVMVAYRYKYIALDRTYERTTLARPTVLPCPSCGPLFDEMLQPTHSERPPTPLDPVQAQSFANWALDSTLRFTSPPPSTDFRAKDGS